MPRLIPFLILGLCGCFSSSTTTITATGEDPPPEAIKPGATQRVTATRPGNDWPRFLGPNADNVCLETGILTTWPKSGLKKLWTAPLGAGYAPPSVSGGKLVHFDGYKTTTRISCRNAETGELLWKYDYPFEYSDLYGYDDGPRCAPLIDGDRVYTYGVEGMLTCLNLADGEKLWAYDSRANVFFHQNFFGVGSTPWIEGDLILIAVGGSEKGPRPFDFRDVKPNGTGIVALNKTTGEVKYKALDDLASYSSPVVVKLFEKRVGLYFARAGLVAFEPTTGKQLFRYPYRGKELESVNAANPVVVDDLIVLSECYRPGTAVVKVKPDLSGVSDVWNDQEKDREERSLACHWNTPIHHEGYLYGSSGRHDSDGDLRCIELKTGDVKWIVKRATRCTLLKIDGHFLSLGENGEVRLVKLNPTQYDEAARWESEDLNNPAWAPPVVSRGLLYLRGKGGLVCYELRK